MIGVDEVTTILAQERELFHFFKSCFYLAMIVFTIKLFEELSNHSFFFIIFAYVQQIFWCQQYVICHLFFFLPPFVGFKSSLDGTYYTTCKIILKISISHISYVKFLKRITKIIKKKEKAVKFLLWNYLYSYSI